MAVIKEFTIGKATVAIHDDFCKTKTPEQIRQTIDKVSQRIMDYYYNHTADNRPE